MLELNYFLYLFLLAGLFIVFLVSAITDLKKKLIYPQLTLIFSIIFYLAMIYFGFHNIVLMPLFFVLSYVLFKFKVYERGDVELLFLYLGFLSMFGSYILGLFVLSTFFLLNILFFKVNNKKEIPLAHVFFLSYCVSAYFIIFA